MGAGNKAGSIFPVICRMKLFLRLQMFTDMRTTEYSWHHPISPRKISNTYIISTFYVHFEHQEQTDCKKHSLQPNYLGMRVLLFCSVAKILIKRLQASLKPRSESLQKQMHLKSDLAKSRLINFIPTLLF